MIPTDLPPTAPHHAHAPALRRAAEEMEAAFLSEMLKHAGVGEGRGSFGGGVGEAQFASLLRDHQAREMAAQGGIGLAERLFNELRARADDR